MLTSNYTSQLNDTICWHFCPTVQQYLTRLSWDQRLWNDVLKDAKTFCRVEMNHNQGFAQTGCLLTIQIMS